MAETFEKAMIARATDRPVADAPLALCEGLELYPTAMPEGFDWFAVSPELAGADWAADDASNDTLAQQIDMQFETFGKVWTGYVPTDLDRMEIGIYCGRISPDHVGIAADYAALFAKYWGPDNHGMFTHTRDFGEVLTGNAADGFDSLTRISVIRKGALLVLIRARVTTEASHGDVADLAGLIGSSRLSPDQPELDFDSYSMALDGYEDLTFDMPANWRLLLQDRFDPAGGGTVMFFNDASDPDQNSGLMVVRMRLPEGTPPMQSEEALRNFVPGLDDFFAENMLTETRVEKVLSSEARTSDDLTGSGIANLVATRLLEMSTTSVGLLMNVVITQRGRDLIAFTLVGPTPDDADLQGTSLNANLVMRNVRDGIYRYWDVPTDKVDAQP